MDNNTLNKIITSGTTVIKNLYQSLLAVGSILLLITLWYPSVICTIVAYCFIIGGVLLLFSLLLRKAMSYGGNMTGLRLFISFLPFIMLIGILLYTIYLLITFQKRISEGNVTPFYYQILRSSVVLIYMQLFLFMNATQNEGFKRTFTIDVGQSLFLFFIEILNLILIIYLGINLNYFVTDG
jgi:hypothetical protein